MCIITGLYILHTGRRSNRRQNKLTVRVKEHRYNRFISMKDKKCLCKNAVLAGLRYSCRACKTYQFQTVGIHAIVAKYTRDVVSYFNNNSQ